MRTRLYVIIVLVIAAIIGGGLFWRARTAQKSGAVPALATGGGELVTVETGAIKIDLSAAGKVVLERKAPLRFKVRGRVAEVPVREGDHVSKGQKLACLETLDIEKSVHRAEAGLKSAEAQLAKVKTGARTEEIASSQAAVAIAKARVRAAEAAAQSAQANVSSTASAVQGAAASLGKLRAGATPLDIQIAEKQVEQARNNLWASQGQRDAVGGRGIAADYEAAKGQVASAESQVAIAQLQLESLKAGPRSEDIVVAQAQVSQAEAAREVAQAQAMQARAEVDVAKAQLEQAEAQLALLQAGAREEDVLSAESQVAEAEAVLEEAQLSLQEVCLLAPFEGLVAQVDVQIGDLIESAQTAVILVDNSLYHITVSVDEADIAQIAEQQQVELSLDAYPDAQAEGRVVYISPLAQDDSGVVSYEMRVDIVRCDVPLREGLSVNARVVTQLLEGRLVVPNSAIIVDDQTGLHYVIRRGPTGDELVKVEIGYSSERLSEVLSGLAEGDQVQLRSSSYREQFREMMQQGLPGGQ